MRFGLLLVLMSAIPLFGAWLFFSIARKLLAIRHAAPRLKVLEGSVVAVHEHLSGGTPGRPGSPSVLSGRASYTTDVLFTTPAGEKITIREGTGTPYRPSVGNPVNVLFDPEGKVQPTLRRDIGASPWFPLGTGILCLVIAILMLWAAYGVLSGRLQTGI